MIVFLTLCYVAVLAVFVKIKIVPLNAFWKISPLLWMLALFLVLFMPMQWGAPAGAVNVYRDVVEIVPNVSGEVADIQATALTPMKKGDVLFTIDPRAYQAEVDRLRSMLAGAEQAVPQLEATFEAASATTEQAAADRELARSIYDVAKGTARSDAGAISKLKVEQAQQSLKAAEAALRTAQANQKRARLAFESEIDGVNTKVAEVRAQLAAAKLNLDWTTVRAPTDGYVVGLTLLPGQRVTNQPLRSWMAYVNAERSHVIVGINQYVLRHIKPGQRAEVALKVLPGRVIGATVSAVALVNVEAQLPPGGSLPPAPTAATPMAPFGVVLELDEDIPLQLRMRGGTLGTAAVYTSSVTATHIIRRVMMRMQAWMNYIMPT